MSTENIAAALNEYGQAMRGDWSQVDGRSVRDQMEEFSSAVEGGEESAWTMQQWRQSLGVCPDGGGHWNYYCETDVGCPSVRAGGE